jgi:pilus assembly protein CpaF
MTLLSLYTTPPAEVNAEAERTTVMNEVIDQINSEYAPARLNRPSPSDRVEIQERVTVLVSGAFRRRNMRPGPAYEVTLAEEITRRLLGLGFLDLLLPPARTDISEIAVYSSGLIQIMRKGAVRFEDVDTHPDAGEIWRVLDRILGPQNKTLNEANPSINAKLPASEHNPGGGRIKAIHPTISPPGKVPAINVRLYEQKPVLPAWLVDRQTLSAPMMDDLKLAMETGKRILICGGTRTGKTTMLSALCNFLPLGWRILKIEDPEEIWIDRPTVQTLEARPQAVGTEVAPYTLANGVDDAMRMSPDYLIIGEVRDGKAAATLFRALMTGHSGACTFHAETPRETVKRLANVMGMDTGLTNKTDAFDSIASAIDLQIQISIRHDKRRVVSISNVAKELKNGNVWFDPIWKYEEGSSVKDPVWNKVGELKLLSEEM